MEIVLLILIIQILVLMFCVQVSVQKMNGYFEDKWRSLLNFFQKDKYSEEIGFQTGFEVQTKCHQKKKGVFEFQSSKQDEQQKNWFNSQKSKKDCQQSIDLFKKMAVNPQEEYQVKLSLLERLAKIDIWRILKVAKKSLIDIDKNRKVRSYLREDHKGENYQDSSSLKFLQFQKEKLKKILHQKMLVKQKRMILNKILKLNQKIFKNRQVFPLKSISEKNEINCFK